MPRRGGPKHKPDTRDRTRAAEALRLRLSGMTWEEIAAQLGYRSPGGPRMAVERMLSRIEVEGATQLRATEGRRLDQLHRAMWLKATAGDCDAIRTVLRISERRSKLLGLDAPVAVAVEGITETEFVEMATQLLAVTGIRPLVEAALPALEPAERAAWLAVDATRGGDDADTEPWSNLSGPGIEAEDTEPEAAELAIFVERTEGDDRGDDAEVVEEVEIVAEVVPLHTGQRRIPASEVVDQFGVPISRGGIARRLGGYDPMAAWRPR